MVGLGWYPCGRLKHSFTASACHTDTTGKLDVVGSSETWVSGCQTACHRRLQVHNMALEWS